MDDAERVVTVYRTSEPYPSLEIAESVLERLIRHIDGAQYRQYGLLLDTRDAVGRNDPAFEELMVRFAPLLFAPFARKAILLRSAIGLMQASRVGQRHDSSAPDVFRNEGEARQYLAGKRPSARPPSKRPG